MSNSSHVFHFTLSAYFDVGLFKYPLFLVTLLLYIFILFSNVLLITIICLNRTFHEPMYVFLCALFLNEVYGSTGLFPFLLLHILRRVHVVPAAPCFLQIYTLHTYGLVEYLSLAVLSYDRYVAICRPLQYNMCMSKSRLAVLIAVPWCYSFAICGVMILLTSTLSFCGNIIHKVYCDNFPVVKLACVNTTGINLYGLIITFNHILLPLICIVTTYTRILKVCVGGSKQTRHKAFSTCAPHVASLINYSIGVVFEILQGRFDMSRVPSMFRIFMSLYFLLCPPLFNPLIYGLALTKVRFMCKSLLFSRKIRLKSTLPE
ncbi:olfactory receptor 142-like [Periophthalmus magnuspinnatus]|uniref:olfactory receptor 142-like n=1 Tax=Periophthalmus magnuspinnatus TaxID=409849 RepID=UPI00145B182B|nr:olfactory receptor 142-like [Periophthalmus magnuspinnatus]